MRLNFDPEQPLADRIRVVENAVVVPWGQGDRVRMARPAGVFTADGEFCDDAMTFRSGNRPTTVQPEFPSTDDIKHHLAGTTLFGGLAYGHFGHALCESTARLWALDSLEEKIDNVLFLPKKKFTWPTRSLSQISKITATMGQVPPLVAYNEPIRVERLVIAPQGFGVNDLIGGAPEFRNFTDKRWKRSIKANGPEKLYISRTEVFRKRGRLLMEEYVERQLEAEGYEVFHPQQHHLETQLARYKAAKSIVSTDNSALHLAAFVASEDCKVAIILRRPGRIYLDFEEQLKRFARIKPLVINTCERFWFRAGESVQYNEVVALLDFSKTGHALKQSGFVTNGDWRNPTGQDIDRALSDFQTLGEIALEEVSIDA